MAFISSSVAGMTTSTLRTSKVCGFSGARVSGTTYSRRVHAPSTGTRVVPRMAESKSKYPSSSVLGLGKDVPSSLYLLASVIALLLGGYSVYKSNLQSPLTPDGVNPQFIVGSLLVPISWGL